MMHSLRFDDTTVELWPDRTRVILRDGGVVHGQPHDTEAYRTTAREHGYGDDTLRLCLEHELMHVALCHWLGIESPTMRLISEHPGAASALAGLEEDAVLAVQKFLRAAGVDFLGQMISMAGRKTR